LARALLVGCGCRARGLGARLADAGWAVRGTSRTEAGLAAIEAAGIEAVRADPDRPGTILAQVGDVTVVLWLLGSATGPPEEVGAIHDERLQSLLEKLVDPPVRGFVYEARGGAGTEPLERGSRIVRDAGERWRIPFRLLDADPADHEGWTGRGLAKAESLIAA
jgi:uncharacterized protein YbjT (DUF2867 family)